MQPLETILLTALRQSASARGCRRCGDPIMLNDAFGLSEGVCSACALRRSGRAAAVEPQAAGWLTRLRRAA